MFLTYIMIYIHNTNVNGIDCTMFTSPFIVNNEKNDLLHKAKDKINEEREKKKERTKNSFIIILKSPKTKFKY